VILRRALGWSLIVALQAPASLAPTPAQRDVIEQEARAAATAAPRDITGDRAALRAVLSQRGFARAQAGSWQADLRRRFSEWLSDLWGRTFGQRVGQRTVAMAFAWAVSIAAVVVLAVWLTRTATRRRKEGPLTIDDGPPRRDSSRALALEAAAMIRSGRTRDAARVAYRAAIHRLEEEGALRLDETRTPRESLGLLPVPHRRRAPLSALTAAFERIWYGSEVPSADEGRAILALLQDLECLSRDRAI
jgi:hypothetical protein